MNMFIKLLIVEDKEDDALLIVEQFKDSGYSVNFLQVWTEEATREALKNESWDAMTCDHNMPGYDSVRALNVLKESGLDIPFIVVSGSIEVLKAVALMKAGAHDYVFKDSLERLVSAVEREIREAQSRKIRRELELSQKFLVEAGNVLFLSLDFEITIQGILNLIVPRFADCCIIDLLENYTSAQVYVTHIDKTKEKQILELKIERRLPQDFNQPHSSKLIPVLDKSEEGKNLGTLLKLDFGSVIFESLQVRDKRIGTITFLNLKHQREFNSMDLALAEELAQRSAVAIDNATLYQVSKEAIQLRDDFLMIASHELKTPVTSLRLKLQTMLRMLQKIGRENLSGDNIIESLKFIDRQIERIIKLIEELLNVSKISKEKIKLNREVVNLNDTVYELADLFSEKLKDSGSPLEIDMKYPIIGFWDPLRIRQILENLLSNAIKYGVGKPIKISTDIENNEARLTIEDKGLGIDKKDQGRIFERFERAVSNLSYGGLGLGLYIIKQIVEAHGGTVLVESKLNEGSKFVVRLPLNETENLALFEH